MDIKTLAPLCLAQSEYMINRNLKRGVTSHECVKRLDSSIPKLLMLEECVSHVLNADSEEI